MSWPGGSAPANDGTANAIAKIKAASNVIILFMAYKPSFRVRPSSKQALCQT